MVFFAQTILKSGEQKRYQLSIYLTTAITQSTLPLLALAPFSPQD